MQDIICTTDLIRTANLVLEESGTPQESWAADIFPFQRQHLMCFLHLPTQYFTMIGPFPKKDLRDIRTHFRDALWSALHTDGFESYLIDNLMGRFESMGLYAGPLPDAHLNLFRTIETGFGLYAKAVGKSVDLDEFSVQIRNAQGVQLAAVTPRNTFELWAQSTSVDD